MKKLFLLWCEKRSNRVFVMFVSCLVSFSTSARKNCLVRNVDKIKGFRELGSDRFFIFYGRKIEEVLNVNIDQYFWHEQ